MDDALFLNIVDKICKKHDCWIDWDKSNIEKYKLSINGDIEDDIINCTDELNNIIKRKKQNENIYSV